MQCAWTKVTRQDIWFHTESSPTASVLSQPRHFFSVFQHSGKYFLVDDLLEPVMNCPTFAAAVYKNQHRMEHKTNADQALLCTCIDGDNQTGNHGSSQNLKHIRELKYCLLYDHCE